MSRQPLLFRVLITLVAAWYGLIAGGQLSLAESAVTSARLAAGGQPPSMSHGAMVMAGMDCHNQSLPSGQKQLCLCIDTGCFPLSVALPAGAPSRCLDVCTPVRVVIPRLQVSLAAADEYLLPPATAPPQA
jgi:hypothetical protein